MLFVDDIILIDQTREELNSKLEQWRRTLESRGIRLSKSKTGYLRCGFGRVEAGGEKVTMRSVVIPRAKKFMYLGSITEDKGDIDEDINQHIGMGWRKWNKASGVLCDKRLREGLKRKFYCMVVRPVLLYGLEYQPIEKTQV